MLFFVRFYVPWFASPTYSGFDCDCQKLNFKFISS